MSGFGNSKEYKRLHHWVYKVRGRPLECEHCGATPIDSRLEWANKSQEYKWEPGDWLSLCKRCHEAYDPRTTEYRTHCKRGHEFTEENTYLYFQQGYPCRICRTCRREYTRTVRASKRKELLP